MKRRRWLYCSLAMLCLAGTACDADPSGADGDVEIRLLDERFNRPAVTVSVGETVRWINTRNTLHDVTPTNSAQAGVWVAFQLRNTGEAQSFTFNTAGTFNYSCTVHDGMDGTITVTP